MHPQAHTVSGPRYKCLVRRSALWCLCRLNELRLLKLKLGESRRELHILKNSVANIDILKHEVHCLGRELLQERTKVKALSEELENPLNVHRSAASSSLPLSSYSSLICSLHLLLTVLILFGFFAFCL